MCIQILSKFAHVDFYIISAGFGLIEENKQIPPYECSFSGMKTSEIKERATKLQIPQQIAQCVENKYDVVFILLGKDYLTAVQDGFDAASQETLLVYFKNKDRLRRKNEAFIPISNEVCTALKEAGLESTNVIGLRGILFKHITSYLDSFPDPKEQLKVWKRDPALMETTYTPKILASRLH
ncbi:MAG: DUF6884 domain-containing protein [Candidatus Hermodarchaeota archaeon]